MRRMRIVVALLLLTLALHRPAAADDAALWAALREGGRVALVRHAATAGGAGDPPGFRLEDCATQRNLTEKGRAQARALGERFRAERIVVAKVLSSQWCRCRETAQLMDLGPTEQAATLNNAFTLRDRIDALTAGARAIIRDWRGPGVLLLSTHGANILPLAGIHPQEGSIVVVEPQPESRAGLRVLGRIPPAP
jgi:phosphohistidine phosphatase SixA